MSQDSEKNDRGTGPSRDGDPQRRGGRSFGRRDDARSQDSDRPRFNRDNDRPKFNRSTDSNRTDSDRPRFNRDGDSPRFNRNDNDRRSREDSADRFNRSNDRPSDDRRWQSGPPRFERDRNERPAGNRDNRFRDDKPRFDRDRRDSRSDEPRRERNDRDLGGSDRPYRSSGPPRFDRDHNDRRERPDQRRWESDKPRFDREDRPRSNDRFSRDNRDDRSSDDRPRFNRDSGPSRFNRNDGPRDTDRSRSADDSRPSRFSRDDKPSFKRTSGFNRDNDQRSNSRFDRDEPRTNSRRERGSRDDDSPNRSSRFTGQQRKESGDRRTGDYTKAPNYELEQFRAKGSFNRGRKDEKPRDKSSEPTPGNDRPRSNDPNTTRLNRYIANSGVCSRREADELIAQGDITVNGKVVTEMGFKVKDGDTVKYGTKTLNPEKFVYVLLNKPKDYLTTTEDPNERKTVMELVADAGNFRMYPVGRLDRNTTGLLLLTNDGELADKLMHPSNNVRKIYQVELDKPITEEHFDAIKKGLELEDGLIKPDAVSIVTPDAYVVGIEIHSGRNRIVRRIFESLGYEVTKLDRTTYAGLTKKELPRGKWRFLDPKEVVKLKYFNS
jgi:23S rRNA pseudouridine2605 synthase